MLNTILRICHLFASKKPIQLSRSKSRTIILSHSLPLYRIIHVPTIDGDNDRTKEAALRVDDFRIEFTWPLQLDIVRIRKKFV